MNDNAHMDMPQPITETDIAEFLLNTPDFFVRHAEVLAGVQLTSPHGNRAVSLQERQAELLRDKIKALELRAVEMMRYGADNMIIADRLQRWTLSLLRTASRANLPETLSAELQVQFSVPQVALRLWGLSADVDPALSAGVNEDIKSFARSLQHPFVGVNTGYDAVKWLARPIEAASLALIPLRASADPEDVFGLIVLASPDAHRFHAGMGTEFLERIGDVASAALSRLQADRV